MSDEQINPTYAELADDLEKICCRMRSGKQLAFSYRAQVLYSAIAAALGMARQFSKERDEALRE